jgi:hypothetical protein
MSSQNNERISRVLNPLLKELVANLLENRPDEPLMFMVRWLEDKCGIKNAKTEREELFELRQEISRLNENRGEEEQEENLENSNNE